MPKYQIVLTNGSKVTLNTDVTLATMKKWKKDNLVSQNFLGNLVMLDRNPREFESNDLDNAYYLAYLNANNKKQYTQEQFENFLSYDIGVAGQLLSEMCSGQNKLDKLQESFKQKTTKNDKGGKKHPK